jgi:tetratricopeptide (TPR) repeat protein
MRAAAFYFLGLSAFCYFQGTSLEVARAAEPNPSISLPERTGVPGNDAIPGYLDLDRTLQTTADGLASEGLSTQEKARLRGVRGDILLGLGDCTNAQTDFDAAVILNPESADAFGLRAVAGIACGNPYKGALSDAQTAIRLDPDSMYGH